MSDSQECAEHGHQPEYNEERDRYECTRCGEYEAYEDW